jgi:hypothetical protein
MKRSHRLVQLASYLLAIGWMTWLMFGWSLAQAEAAASLEITEVMYDAPGNDSGQEWIELVNTSREPVTITTGSGAGSWRFFDTSNHTFTPFQGSNTVGSDQFAILAADPARFLLTYPAYQGTIFKVALTLPNRPTTLKLSADKGLTWFHERTYLVDGANGDGLTLEWQNQGFVPSASLGGNPGTYQPIEPAPPERPPEIPPEISLEPSPSLRPGLTTSPGTIAPPPAELPLIPVETGPIGLTITEIAYNPTGSDTDSEWLEVRNTGSRPVEIVTGSGATAWRIQIGNQRHTIRNLIGTPQFGPGDRLVISRKIEHFYVTHPTFIGKIVEASFSLPNTRGIVRLSLDGGSSWLSERSYTSTEGANGDGRTLEQAASGEWRSSPETDNHPGIQPVQDSSPPATILINEILPYPFSGEEEWIELINPNPYPINLINWLLDDRKGGGSKPFQIPFNRPAGTTIEPGQRFVFPAHETNLSLTNTSDMVRLLRPDQTVVDEIPYENPEQGAAWMRLTVGSAWTNSPTPGDANQLTNALHPRRAAVLPTTIHPPVIDSSTPPTLVDQTQPTKVTLSTLPEGDGWLIKLETTVVRRTPSGFVLGSAERPVRVILPEGVSEKQRARAHQRVSLIGTLTWDDGEALVTISEVDASKLIVSDPPQKAPATKKASPVELIQPAIVPPGTIQEIILPAPITLSLPDSRQASLHSWTNYLPLDMIMSIIVFFLVIFMKPGFGLRSTSSSLDLFCNLPSKDNGLYRAESESSREEAML